MIDLRGSKFTDIMPPNLAGQLETQAFAYAMGRQIQKVCAAADRVRIYADLDAAAEDVLDTLAVEQKTPIYDSTYSVETKRALILGTASFYAKLGTPEAVNWLIRTMFGSGEIREWFQYGGQPHHFKIMGISAKAMENGYEEFLQILSKIKRLSSHLDTVQVKTGARQQIYAGFAVRVGEKKTVSCGAAAVDDAVWYVDENGVLLLDERGRALLEEDF
jgi:phage tail P2-like protein